MGSPRLNPFAHLVRTIQASKEGSEADRKHVISLIYDFKNTPRLTVDKSALICSGLYAYFQAIVIRAMLPNVKQGSAAYKTMTWCHSKHMDTYLKSLRALGKEPMPRTKGRNVDNGQGGPALWHPRPAKVTPGAGDAGI